MLRITPIKSTTQRNGRFQGIRWVAGNVSLLLLLTAGLQLFAHQTLMHSSAATIILALVLATWSYVLGLGLVLFLSVGWLIEWLHKGSADALVPMGERVQKVPGAARSSRWFPDICLPLQRIECRFHGFSFDKLVELGAAGRA